jgi:hypothetical protein
MIQVSSFRLYLLRAAYLFIAAGLALYVLPAALRHDRPWEMMEGVVNCMLAAMGLLCLLGLRYPLQMLPILMWEMVWKALWLTLVALPLFRSGQMDEAAWMNTAACLMGLIVPIAMPWRYVFERYVKQSGDRWTTAKPAPQSGAERVTA